MRAPIFNVAQGDARSLGLPDKSVQMIMLSPPYYNLRAYLDEPQEIGREDTRAAYISNLVECAREWRRVLRDDGTLWINVGDGYASQGGPEPSQTIFPHDGASNTQNSGRSRTPGALRPKNLIGVPWRLAFALQADDWILRSAVIWNKGGDWSERDLQAKEDAMQALAQVRETVTGSLFGLSADLDKILKKAEKSIERLMGPGAVMPESVKDRPTSAYEMLFMFSKSAHYFADMEAVKGDLRCPEAMDGSRVFGGANKAGANLEHARTTGETYSKPPSGRNARNVWNIPTESKGTFVLPDGRQVAHFAAYPEELCRKVVRIGTSEAGACATCGALWVRVLRRPVDLGVGDPYGKAIEQDDQDRLRRLASRTHRARQAGRDHDKPFGNSVTIGWRPDCHCHGEEEPVMVTCRNCRGTGLERTSTERKADHFPESGQRESGKRGVRGNVGDTSMEETGDVCPTCGGAGEVEGSGFSKETLESWPRVPCTVLDPMCGTGTTGRAALSLGRSVELRDLSPEYVDLARARLEALPGDVPQVPPKRKRRNEDKDENALQFDFWEVT